MENTEEKSELAYTNGLYSEPLCGIVPSIKLIQAFT